MKGSSMRTEEAIKKRVSVRKYSDRPVSPSDLKKIIGAGRMAATANNIQPVEFIIVTGREKRRELASIAPNNGPYMEYAPAVIAVIARPEKYYLEDGSASTQNILVMARALGIGSVWVAGDKKEYAPEVLRALGVPADYRLVSLVCLGYPEKDFPVTPKKNPDEITHWETYGLKEEDILSSMIADFEEEIRSLEGAEPDAAERMNDILMRLKEKLNGKDTSGEKGDIEEAVIGFEASHPVAADILGRIASQLSSMGI